MAETQLQPGTVQPPDAPDELHTYWSRLTPAHQDLILQLLRLLALCDPTTTPEATTSGVQSDLEARVAALEAQVGELEEYLEEQDDVHAYDAAKARLGSGESTLIPLEQIMADLDYKPQ